MLSIFVSSTFGDMQAERDVIRQRVLPRLQRVAAKYGESVRIVDLRWGVNTTSMTEEQATEKIMDVCFEQIDKCDGRMLCLLGNRYGWVPNYDHKKISERYGINLQSKVSATELEIQYGILQRSNPQNAIVFIRDQIEALPDEIKDMYCDDNPCLATLKTQLLTSPYCLCRNYSLKYQNDKLCGLDAFEEMVFTSLYDYVTAEFDDDDTDQYIKTKNYFDAHIDAEAQDYYELPGLEEVTKHFFSSNTTFGILKADAGMGKTAFSSHLCSKLKNAKKIFYFFCGHNAESETPLQLLKYLIYQVSIYLGVNFENDSDDLSENSHMLAYLVEQICEDVIFFVDGVNHLICPYEERLAWVPEKIPDNIKFFITTSSDDKSYERLNQFSSAQIIEVPKLTKPENFIKHLLSMSGKDIQTDILSTALKDHKIDNYYFAKMIADALAMMDQYDFQNIKESGDGIGAINSFLKDALKRFPKSVEGMALFLLHDFGKRIAPDIIPDVYIYIACNDGGLRASDLEKMFGSKWDDISFETYISLLSGIIVEKENGCYDFSSSIVRDAVEKIVKWKYKKKVIKHIESLPNDDPLKLRCCLQKSLLYEHYDIVERLINENKSSMVLVSQFTGCLNYLEDEITTLFKKYDLYQWFFENVINHTSSIQEREACIKIVSANLSSIPISLRTLALEFLGDSFSRDGDFLKAKLYYIDAAKELDSTAHDLKGRVLYKLATILCVNSNQEYDQLREVLMCSVEYFQKSSETLDVEHRMFFIAAKYQLLMLELNYALHGINSMQVFDVSEMRLKDGLQTPHLSYISKQKIGELEEEVVSVLKRTIESFNQYRRESESVFQDALNNDSIAQIIKPFMLTLNAYDVFGIPLGRIERLKEIQETIEGKLKDRFNLSLYQTLGSIEYELAQDEKDTQAKKQRLLKCCSIWGQFVTQQSLPEFTESYINAEMDLIKIFLAEDNNMFVDEHLTKWSQARFDFVVNDLRGALKDCKRYPDEIHLAVLENVRDEIADVHRTKAKIKYLNDSFVRCQNIGMSLLYHWVRANIYKDLDNFESREKVVEANYVWLKKLYLGVKKQLELYPLEKDEIEFVCIYLLKLMQNMLDLLRDIVYKEEQAIWYTKVQYYSDYIFVLEERHSFDMQRLEKIWYGYSYAKTLMAQAGSDILLVEHNYSFAMEILNTVKMLLFENEVTPYNPSYPMIDKKRVNSDLCLAKITLGSYYKDVGRYLLAANTYESAIEIALSLIGASEDSQNQDYLFWKTAMLACLQAMEIYAILEMPVEVSSLTRKYEKIRTLVE